MPQLQYGRLTVLAHHHTDQKSQKFMLCLCACGKLSVVKETHLRTGHTTSCGCKAPGIKHIV